MKSKKIIVLLLSVLMLISFGLVACGGDDGKDEEENETTYTLSLNISAISLYEEESFQLQATVKENGLSVDKQVVWSISEQSNGIISVSSTGKITAISEGEGQVICTFNDITKFCSVIVSKYYEEPFIVTLNKKEMLIDKSEISTIQLTAQVEQENQIITDKEIIWKSSDEDIATVNENGEIEILTSGTVMIQARVNGENGAYALDTCNIKIVDNSLLNKVDCAKECYDIVVNDIYSTEKIPFDTTVESVIDLATGKELDYIYDAVKKELTISETSLVGQRYVRIASSTHLLIQKVLYITNAIKNGEDFLEYVEFSVPGATENIAKINGENKLFKLVKDIEITATQSEIESSRIYNSFDGYFDGNGKTITYNVDCRVNGEAGIFYGIFDLLSGKIVNTRFVINYNGTFWDVNPQGVFANYFSGEVENCVFEYNITNNGTFGGSGNKIALFTQMNSVYKGANIPVKFGSIKNCLIFDHSSTANRPIISYYSYNSQSEAEDNGAIIENIVCIRDGDSSVYGNYFINSAGDGQSKNIKNFYVYNNIEDAVSGKGIKFDSKNAEFAVEYATTNAKITEVIPSGITITSENYTFSGITHKIVTNIQYIKTAKQLDEFFKTGTGVGVLKKDITLNLSLIAGPGDEGYGQHTYYDSFAGKLDGKGHKLTVNLTMKADVYHKGLFGNMSGTFINTYFDITVDYGTLYSTDSTAFINYCSGIIKNCVIAYEAKGAGASYETVPIYRCSNMSATSPATIENVIFKQNNPDNVGYSTALISKQLYGANINNIVCICGTAYATNPDMKPFGNSAEANATGSAIENFVIYGSLTDAYNGNGYKLDGETYFSTKTNSTELWSETTESANAILIKTDMIEGITISSEGEIKIGEYEPETDPALQDQAEQDREWED